MDPKLLIYCQFLFAYLLHPPLPYFWVMKALVAYILAFYVLALSCIPCQDEVQPARSFFQPRIAAPSASWLTSTGDHSHSIDLCSPFCICACCASVTIAAVVTALPDTPVSRIIPTAAFAYLQIQYTGTPAGIWQPPQAMV